MVLYQVLDFLDLNHDTWERCNHLVHSWIINYVTESISHALGFREYDFNIWEDLQEQFSKIDGIRTASPRSSINTLKQGSKFVLDYFTEMKSFWEELNSHRPMPSCTCIPRCRCEAMCAVRNQRMEDQVIQFLTCLNHNFMLLRVECC